MSGPPVTRIVLPPRVRSACWPPSSESEPPQEIERLSDRPQAQREAHLDVRRVAVIESPDVDEEVDALIVVGELGAGVEELPLLDVVVGLELEVDGQGRDPQPPESADLVAVVERDEVGVRPATQELRLEVN
jgi:hypothetical protein